MDREFKSREEAAAAAGCSVATVARAIRSGQLRAARRYGRLWIARPELDRWVADRRFASELYARSRTVPTAPAIDELHHHETQAVAE